MTKMNWDRVRKENMFSHGAADARQGAWQLSPAKRSTPCTICWKPIPVGEMMWWHPNARGVHEWCKNTYK